MRQANQPSFISVADLPGNYTQFNTGIGFFFKNVLAYNVAGAQFAVWPNGG